VVDTLSCSWCDGKDGGKRHGDDDDDDDIFDREWGEGERKEWTGFVPRRSGSRMIMTLIAEERSAIISILLAALCLPFDFYGEWPIFHKPDL